MSVSLPDTGEEWRDDVLTLTGGVEATYIGWTNRGGRPIVGVLRGAVVSPLAAPPDAEFNWADCGAGAHSLGEAILADAMGPAWRSVGETSEQRCGDVVKCFVKEMIDRLPHDGFELASTDVLDWLRRQHLPVR